MIVRYGRDYQNGSQMTEVCEIVIYSNLLNLQMSLK